MKKAFKSKVDFIFLSALLTLSAAGVYLIYAGIIAGAIALGIIILFLIYLYIDTLYIVTDDKKLKIKTGFLYHREIYIKSIKKVKATKNHSASPALSSDRLEIRYNRYGRVVISPTHQSEFIRELKEANPRISVEENK